MKPSFLTASLALSLILAAGSLQAQPGHFQNRIEYNPPSRFIHVDSPELDPRRFPDHPTLGFFGDFTRRGLIVTRVIRGSEACRIGLQPRDTILQANGYAIHCERDWQRGAGGRLPGSPPEGSQTLRANRISAGTALCPGRRAFPSYPAGDASVSRVDSLPHRLPGESRRGRTAVRLYHSKLNSDQNGNRTE